MSVEEAAAVSGTDPDQEASDARPESRPETRTQYRPDIDGIRGVAATLVIGFHAAVPGFRGGYLGVDLFFVVSGYVISGLLLRESERTGRVRWLAFYARRARRLIPAQATMLVAVLILSYLVLAPTGPQQETADSAASAAGFVSNFFFWQHTGDIHYFAHTPGTGVLLHTWSLAVEEQFYLAVPIALLLSWLVARLLRVPSARTLLVTTCALTVASLGLAIGWSTTHPEAAYYLPSSRAFEFLLGVLLALVAPRRVLGARLREVMGVAGALIIAYCLWRPLPVDGFPSYWALLPCGAVVLMVWAGVGGRTVITRLLSNRVLVGLGLVSYGWYLWHWPLLVLGEGENLIEPVLWVRIVLVLVALVVAVLSRRFIESRFYQRSGPTRSGTTWGPGRVVVSGVLVMAAVAGLAVVGGVLADHTARSPQWQQVAAEQNDYPAMPDGCLSPGQYIPDHPGRCDLVPFVPGRPTVVLWGDSHAWMYIPALRAAAEQRHVNLAAFVMGTCPPFEDPTALGGCAKSNAEALAFVTRLTAHKSPVRVVMSGTWEAYLDPGHAHLPAGMNVDYLHQMAGYFSTGATPLFEALRALGVGVDLVAPTPILPRTVPLCEARTRPYSCDAPRAEAIVDEQATLSWLRSRVGALPASSRLIDVTPALCSDTECFAESHGVVNYLDDNHLRATASLGLERYFLPSVDLLTGSGGTA